MELDEPPGHAHGLPGDVQVGLGESREVGGGEGGEVFGETRAQPDRPFGSTTIAQDSPARERESIEMLVTPARCAVGEGRSDTDDVGELEEERSDQVAPLLPRLEGTQAALQEEEQAERRSEERRVGKECR